MIRKTITRTMATSTVNAFTLKVVEGKPVVENLDPVTVAGKLTEVSALKVMKEKHGKDTPVTIASIQVEESLYEITVEDFMKYAKKVEKDEAKKEN